MKNVFLFLITLIMLISFSGCNTVHGEYKKEYISKNLNTYLSKVNQEPATVIFTNGTLAKKPTGFRGSILTINMHTGEIITNVQKEFLLEYFNNVNVSNKVAEKGLTLESEVVDYTYKYLLVGDGAEITTKIKVSFYKDGVKKFTKFYESTDDNKIFLSFNNLLISENAIKLFNKQILKMFETSVKKDMVQSL